MVDIHPQYIKDTAGQNLIVIPQSEFDTLMENLEELEDIRLYDETKKNDTGERIAIDDAFRLIETKQGKG